MSTPPRSGAVPLSALLDHSRLAAGTPGAAIDRLCDEAREHGFAAVCVNGVHVARAAARLAGSPIPVAATVGFPLGAMAPAAKAEEARIAIEDGARELDVVADLGALVEGDDARALADLAGVVAVAEPRGVLVKVILETALLPPERVVRAAELVREAGAGFVKTSTGFGPGGATVEAVALLARTVAPALGVKAAGGIRTAADARRMVAAGATRLGTSNALGIVAESGER